MGLLIAPLLSVCMLEFTLVDVMVDSLHSQVGEWVLTIVCAYARKKSPGARRCRTGDSIVLLGLTLMLRWAMTA